MRAREEWGGLGKDGEGHGGVEGPGKGDEAHGRLGRAMESIVRSREESKRARECCRWPGKVVKVIENHGV